MRVKICEYCMYTVGDLAEVYDSGAAEWCCANCPMKEVICTTPNLSYRLKALRTGRTKDARTADNHS